jgi:hypothetical protein
LTDTGPGSMVALFVGVSLLSYGGCAYVLSKRAGSNSRNFIS